jgi:hypothetical protein
LTLGRQSLLETVTVGEPEVEARIVSVRTSAEPTRLQKTSDTSGKTSTLVTQEHVKQASCPSLTVTLSGFPEEGICNAELSRTYSYQAEEFLVSDEKQGVKIQQIIINKCNSYLTVRLATDEVTVPNSFLIAH